MLKLTNQGLRRSNVVLNSPNSCIPNTPKEFSRTPEMSFSEMVSKPRMFFEKAKSAIAFKQLKGFTNTHSWRKLNKQMDMINNNVGLIDFKPFSVSNSSQEELTIHSETVKLEEIFCIFNFPHEVECILSEAMLPRFQIHFSSPKIAHTNLNVYFEEPSIQTLPNSHAEILNFEDGDSSLNLKVCVSSLLM